MFTARGLFAFALLVSPLVPVTLQAQGTCCMMPDNGAGTANLPPLCPYLGHMRIVDGLPPGTTIEIQTEILALSLTSSGPGGSLGGTFQDWNGQILMTMSGTGTLLGYNRIIVVPTGMPAVTHSGPRTPFAPVQSFPEVLFRLFGQVVGDPDFDLLRITAGTDYGLPSPGHTTLTQSGPDWSVDSFFDITYRIDFVGSPGSVLQGRSGSTTGTDRHTVCPGQVSVQDTSWGALKALYHD